MTNGSELLPAGPLAPSARNPLSNTALVNSSTKSGTPSVFSRICFNTSSGSSASLAIPLASSVVCRRAKRLSEMSVT